MTENGKVTRPLLKPRLLSVAIASYLALGVFPFAALEEDGMRLALGIQCTSLYGGHRYSYLYAAQGGTHELGRLVAHLGLDPFRALSVLTALSAASLFLFGSLFLKRITGETTLFTIVSLALFQETYIAAYYPNSSMIAAGFIAIGLFLATSPDCTKHVVLSGTSLAVALWCRIDSLALLPAFLVLLTVPRRQSLKALIAFLASFGAVAAVLIGIVSRVSPRDYLAQFFIPAGSAPDVNRVLSVYSTLFTLAVMYFVAYGMCQLLRARRWRLAALAMIGPLPVIWGYGLNVNTPKYLLYTAVFFAIPICSAFGALVRRRATGGGTGWALAGVLLFTGQYVFTPAYEALLNRSIEVSTADYVRLRGAIGFSPAIWSRRKTDIRRIEEAYRTDVQRYVNASQPSYIITHDWMANQWFMYDLQEHGFRVVSRQTPYADVLEHGEGVVLKKGSTVIELLRWHPEKPLSFPDSVEREISRHFSVLYVGQPYAERPHLELTSKVLGRFRHLPWVGEDRFRTVLCWREGGDAGHSSGDAR